MKYYYYKYLKIPVIVLYLCVLPFSGIGQNITIIQPTSQEIPNFSGNKQHQTVGQILDKPLIVQIIAEDSVSLANIPVHFSFISYPTNSKGYKLTDTMVYTDNNGIAKNFVTLGSQNGEYLIMAQIETGKSSKAVYFNAHARKANWVFMLIIGILGGLGLFLFGMSLMSEGMQKTAGDKMRSILSTLTNNRFLAVGVGAFVTMIIQSSSATTVMLVSFVQSRLMRFSQTIGVILGAAIGTTITAQLIAFKLTDYSLLMIAVGFAIQVFSKSERYKNIGETLLGFGILFFGMDIMSKSMYPLRSYEPFIEALITLENPIIGILMGLIFTALIQSSSAFIGIMIILASQGFLSLEASIPLIIGSNIGTAITAILASLNSNREAKKVALAHTLFKIVGALIFIWWLPTFGDLVKYISPQSTDVSNNINTLTDEVPRQIANAHTIFNISITLLALPFTRLTARIIHKILPPKTDKTQKNLTIKHLDKSLLNKPTLALNLAKQEVLRMANIVLLMVTDIIITFFDKDTEILNQIKEKENQVDYLRDEIKSYLLEITRKSTNDKRVQEAFQMMFTIKELEQIGDIVATNLSQHAKKWIASDNEFSDTGRKEIIEYHLKSLKQISRAIEVFKDVNLEKAKEMKQKFKTYSQMAIDYERLHYERLRNENNESITSTKAHIELINMFQSICSHATNIARILLKWK